MSISLPKSEMPATKTIPLVQVTREGKQSEITYPCPDLAIWENANRFIEAGGEFTCTQLDSGQLCLQAIYEGEVISSKACVKGPNIHNVMRKLVKDATAFRKEQDSS